MIATTRFFILAALVAASVVAFSGCATRSRMAFQDDTQQLTEKSKPVYLMSVTVRNSYRTWFQPRLHTVFLQKPDAKDAADRISFAMDAKAKADEADSEQTGNRYLLRMELDPGDYELVAMAGMSAKFPFIAHFMVPVHSDLVVDRPGVFYLGHLDATVRERHDNEFKAGPSIPLLDQAVAGASGGTYDIAITDAFASDEPVFREKFPALKQAAIAKAVLPPFDRGRAQQWWEAH